MCWDKYVVIDIISIPAQWLVCIMFSNSKKDYDDEKDIFGNGCPYGFCDIC